MQTLGVDIVRVSLHYLSSKAWYRNIYHRSLQTLGADIVRVILHYLSSMRILETWTI